MGQGVKSGASSLLGWFNKPLFGDEKTPEVLAQSSPVYDALFGAKVGKFAESRRPRVPIVDSAQKAGEDAGKGLEQGIRLALDMHSPSRVMYNIGRDGIAAGLTQGTKAGVKDARRTDAFTGGAIVFSGPVTIAVQPPDGSDASVQRSLTEAMLRVVERASRSPGASMVQR